MTPTHTIFIDDSGTKEYAATSDKYNLNGRGVSTYFVFCGILATNESAGVITKQIIDVKLQYFGDSEVEIKSHWLRNPDKQRNNYLEPYSIDQQHLANFCQVFYEILQNADLKIIASVVHKAEMQERYPRPYYPPAVAYETLIMRANSEVAPLGSLAVVIDDTTGKTPKGNEYKKNLNIHHNKLVKYGSTLRSGKKLPCLSTIKFVNSRNSHLVQMADLCAYNVHRQFQLYGAEWETLKSGTLPMYEYFEVISSKIRKSREGRITGYGIVKMPEITKVLWFSRK